MPNPGAGHERHFIPAGATVFRAQPARSKMRATRAAEGLLRTVCACLFVLLVASALPLTAEPGSTLVYVTKTGKKYHRDGCNSLSRSRIPIRLDEAAHRYGPCANCRPPLLTVTAPPTANPRAVVPSSPQSAPVSSRCAALTKKGTQCTRRATHGAYCWQHAQ